LILFLLMAVGFAAGRLRFLDEGGSKAISKLLVNFILPALILSSMQRPFSAGLRDQALVALAISFGVYALAFPLAFLLARLERAPAPESGAHVFGAVFSNVAFMGFPILEAFFGKESIFMASVYNIPFQVLAFSVGPVILAQGSGEGLRIKASSFVTPAAVAAVIGFACFLGGLAFPPTVQRALDLLGGTTTPLSMILIGAIISRMRLRSVAGNPRLYVTTAFRLVLFPAVVYGILRLAGFSGLLLGLPVVIAAMPVAANSAILAEAYGGDAATASSLVVLSTLLSLGTIPVLALILH
jgi:predicted permease